MSAVSEEMLTAYVDGELDAPGCAEVERAMAEDPVLAARAARHRALRARLQSTFSDVLGQPVPAHLVAATRVAANHPAAVIGLSQERARRALPLRERLSLPRWAAIAASAALGIIAGVMLQRWPGTDLTQNSEGALLARGDLARTLTDQLAATASGAITVGLTFRDKGGSYCRTFAVRQTRTLVGLACHEGAVWQVVDTASVGTPPDTGGAAYRPAASALPPALLAAVNERIAGEALDAQAEAAARAAHWRSERQN